MSTLSRELDRYLAVRRGLGFELRTDERILRRFIKYVDSTGFEHVNAGAFIGWRESFGDANQHTWSRRLGIVRIFAQWLHGTDPRHEVPPRDLVPSRRQRSRPYIYTPDEIRAIVETAATLPSIKARSQQPCHQPPFGDAICARGRFRAPFQLNCSLQ